MNCQINPTGQPDYFCFACATHQFPYFTLSFYHSVFLYVFLSHSFNLVCVLCTPSSAHDVIRNPLFISLFSSFYFVFFAPSLVLFILVLLPFFFTFISKPLVTKNLVSILFLYIKSYLSCYHLAFSSGSCCFLHVCLSNTSIWSQGEGTLRHSSLKLRSSEALLLFQAYTLVLQEIEKEWEDERFK